MLDNTSSIYSYTGVIPFTISNQQWSLLIFDEHNLKYCNRKLHQFIYVICPTMLYNSRGILNINKRFLFFSTFNFDFAYTSQIYSCIIHFSRLLFPTPKSVSHKTENMCQKATAVINIILIYLWQQDTKVKSIKNL